jgi:hypothetical protein
LGDRTDCTRYEALHLTALLIARSDYKDVIGKGHRHCRGDAENLQYGRGRLEVRLETAAPVVAGWHWLAGKGVELFPRFEDLVSGPYYCQWQLPRSGAPRYVRFPIAAAQFVRRPAPNDVENRWAPSNGLLRRIALRDDREVPWAPVRRGIPFWTELDRHRPPRKAKPKAQRIFEYVNEGSIVTTVAERRQINIIPERYVVVATPPGSPILINGYELSLEVRRYRIRLHHRSHTAHEIAKSNLTWINLKLGLRSLG